MVLYMSLTGSFLAAVVLLLRRLAPTLLPPRFFIILWDIVLARLLAPLVLPLPIGPHISWAAAAAGGTAPAPGNSLLLWVWAAGAAVTAAVMAVLCRREWKLLEDALPPDADTLALISAAGIRPGRTRILVSDRIGTPVAAGPFRPRIVLPKAAASWDARTAAFALQHELTHIRRWDNLQKLAMTAALCVHWFNPLVWLMRDTFDRDLEKSCDEGVISAFGEDSRCDYAETLVQLAARPAAWSVCGQGFGRSAVHERIAAMMRHKAATARSWVVAAAVLLCASVAFAGASPAPAAEAVQNPSSEVSYIFDTQTGRLYCGDELVAVLDVTDAAAYATSIIATGSSPDQIDLVMSPAGAAAGTYTWTAGNAE